MPTDSRFRRWLVDWFGFSQKTDPGDQSVSRGSFDNLSDHQGPVFSLGDTKQDVVVSYRAAQNDKS